MPRDLISQEARGALYDYFANLSGAQGQIRKFANAAGLSQGKPEWIKTPFLGHSGTEETRRRRLFEYLDDVDWTSQVDVEKVLRFYELVLGSLEVGSVEFDAIAKPLERDGYVFDKEKRRLVTTTYVDVPALKSAMPREQLPILNIHLRRIEESLVVYPDAVVGSSKELIETVCRTILKNHGQTSPTNTDLGKLVKEAIDCLNLSALNLPTNNIKRFVNNLISIVQTIGELRNSDGTGHGRTTPTRLERRHARLVFGITASVCTFLLESEEVSQPAAQSSQVLEPNEVSQPAAQSSQVLEPDEVSQPAAQSSQVSCVRCGYPIEPEDSFCESCGAPIL